MAISCTGNVFEGERFKEFPYTAHGIISGEDGKNPEETFTNVDDVLDYALRLKKESEDFHGENANMFKTALDVFEQLAFFTFVGHLVDSDSQKDIKRYLYSTETQTPPYKGDFGDQPALWVDKYFMIKGMRDTIKARNRKKAND